MLPRPVDVLLIGGGVASARCARTLRRRGFTGSIRLVGEEMTAPYNRPPLSKELLRGQVDEELVLAEPPHWYERRGVDLELGIPVVRLDAEARIAELADGRRIGFGRCLLATGARPRRLPVPGGEHARLLRTLEDALRLRDAAPAGSQAVLIGGGFIGVEVAASLAGRGARVTLLEAGDQLWAGSLGDAVSAWAAERLAELGVEVRFDATVHHVEPEVVVAAGGRLAADLILAGIGVVPRDELAHGTPIHADDGIVVDDRQTTSVPGIYAAGDVARPAGGRRVEHWHAARESGEAAALAMLDVPVPPRRAPWIFSELGPYKLDVVGEAATWDALEARAGLVAYLRDGAVRQLAILDAAVPVEGARDLVERRAAPGELEMLAAMARVDG
jgi:3-phenylpropionate/trans-cinnamate dioxygenase ferredoxin reductase component